VVLISVGATLAVIAIAAALFHFCKTREKAEDEDREKAALANGSQYAAMQN
jgi:hypothetical protein